MNRMDLVKEQIDSINKELENEFKYNLKNIDVQIDSNFVYDIKKQINFCVDKVEKNYSIAMDSLSIFVTMILKMLNDYERHLVLNRKINYLILLKNKYIDFCYKEYGELKSKIDWAIKQLESIKMSELTTNSCSDHVKLFNLLNNQTYTHYSDVIDYLNDIKINERIKKKINNKVEEIISEGLVTIQQIEYLIDKLNFYKSLLCQKEKEAQKQIQRLNGYTKNDGDENSKDRKGQIRVLIDKDRLLWPKKQHNLLCLNYDKRENINNKLNNKRNIFDDIGEYILRLDESSLCLIVSFCAQLNLFDVTYRDKISGKAEILTIERTNAKSFVNYIKLWIDSFKQYLDMNIGGTN